MNPLFSIIAPSLGRLALWKSALTSAVNQEFTNFEIIAVNSHDSEEGVELIASFNDPRIRYITPAAGDSHLNWDIGYRNARGEYILWLDDDNYLLPHALSTLARIIQLHHPDIATGDHIHWYEAHHPVKNLRNQIAIPLPLFTHALTQANARNYIRILYGMPTTGAYVRTRFHFSETALRKDYLEKILGPDGHIDFAGTTVRLYQLILLASTRSIWYVDSPIAIIIQMGDSMAYRWSNKKARQSRFVAKYALSPLSADLYCNYIIENLLKAKEICPDALAGFEINWNSFLKTYTRELLFLEQSWSQFFHIWKEVPTAMEKRTSFSPIERRIIFLGRLSVALSIKLLKEFHLYDIVREIGIGSKKQDSLKKSLILNGNRYAIKNIQECASLLPHIIEEELQIPFRDFSGTRESL